MKEGNLSQSSLILVPSLRYYLQFILEVSYLYVVVCMLSPPLDCEHFKNFKGMSYFVLGLPLFISSAFSTVPSIEQALKCLLTWLGLCLSSWFSITKFKIVFIWLNHLKISLTPLLPPHQQRNVSLYSLSLSTFLWNPLQWVNFTDEKIKACRG